MLLALAVAACSPRKKLIEFGWDEPDTAFLRRHIEVMEKTPFDGCVFHVNFRNKDGGEGNFTWRAWGRHAFTEAELTPAIEDLRATRLVRFKDNFLRFNTTPADIDWFDDFTPVLVNAKLAARVAREGRARGIMLDDEQYEGQLFHYARQKHAATKSWDAYAAQARRRGRELMRAFEEGYPGVTVFLTFGYSLPRWQMGMLKRPLPDVSYGLLAPLLDGMLEGARTGRLVDGYELSYDFKQPERFRLARAAMARETLEIVADPDAYQRFTSFGFGLWMDYHWRIEGWFPEQPAKNYFQPEEFETAVQAALETADEYVWIYTETPRWWSKEGGPVKLPPAYDEAVRRAKAKARTWPTFLR